MLKKYSLIILKERTYAYIHRLSNGNYAALHEIW